MSGDEATRVFARTSADPEPTARFVRHEEDEPVEPPEDDRARTFVRPSGGFGAAPAHSEATRQFTRAPEPAVPREPRHRSAAEEDDGGLDGLFGGDDDTPTTRRPSRGRPRGPGRLLLRALALLVLVAVALPFATWGWVWYTARQDERPPSDAIVVLGASQYNGRPSPVFEARLRHAAELYEEGVAPAVVTVGGNQPGDNFTEGGSGARWLGEQGVPEG
ncbi:YdcF family protein, partial [Thermobifida halotolerans]|uniref:YdcF family protein n=1 Tax=Thermobifida halotolerans TaxID=483545 RepID=UPI001F20AD5E